MFYLDTYWTLFEQALQIFLWAAQIHAVDKLKTLCTLCAIRVQTFCNLFLYFYTQNQFTIQMYIKPVYYAGLHKGLTVTYISKLIMKRMYMDRKLLRIVHGLNITKVRLCANPCSLYMCTQCKHLKLVLYTLCTSVNVK